MMRTACLLALLAAAVTAQTPVYNSFVTGAAYRQPPALSVAPGQIATFFVGGLPQTQAGLGKLVALFDGPSGASPVTIVSAFAFDSSTLAITIQIPFGLDTSASYTIQFAETDQASQPGLNQDPCAEGACTHPAALLIVPAIPHIISTCDLFYQSKPPQAGAVCHLAVTHQNGSLVTNASPAKPGEALSLWVLGLGDPVPGSVPSGTGPIEMNDVMLVTSYYAGLTSASTPYLFAGLASPASGLYQINFVVPPPASSPRPCANLPEASGGNFQPFVYRPFPVDPTGSETLLIALPVSAQSGQTICVDAG